MSSETSNSPRLLIVIPTLNERDNIQAQLTRLFELIPFANVLVVDDNSPDGTGEWCEQHAKQEPRLNVVHRSQRLGIGAATCQGMQIGLEQGYDWIGSMDGDGSHDPVYLSQFASELNNSAPQIFIGSRYCAGGQIDNWPWNRRIASRLVNQASRMILRVPISDYSSAYRVYHRECLEKCDVSSLRSQGYAYLEEILVKLHRADAKFTEFPICFNDRIGGKSKAGPRQALQAIRDLVKLFALRR